MGMLNLLQKVWLTELISMHAKIMVKSKVKIMVVHLWVIYLIIFNLSIKLHLRMP